MKEKIAIFVPVYFRNRTVYRSIEALLSTRESKGYDVTIVIVDNRSDDELRAFLKSVESANKGVHVILLDNNIGKAKAITLAAKKFPDFDWFINFDSDILPQRKGWPGILADCFKAIPRAGMIATAYAERNNPMPVQPFVMEFVVGEAKHVFRYGGQVAGGCFLTDKLIWSDVGYRSKGVYGGVDGMFRQSVANSLQRKCGYIEDVVVEHIDDRDENADYHKWKLGVQGKIKVHSPMADPKILGNDKGFWDK